MITEGDQTITISDGTLSIDVPVTVDGGNAGPSVPNGPGRQLGAAIPGGMAATNNGNTDVNGSPLASLPHGERAAAIDLLFTHVSHEGQVDSSELFTFGLGKGHRNVLIGEDMLPEVG